MSRNRKKSNPFFTFIKVIFIIIIAVCLAVYAAVKTYLRDLEPIKELNNYTRNAVTNVYSADNHLIKSFRSYKYEHVSINEIPQYLKDGIISTEDKNFYSHEGYDITGIIRSVIVNVLNKKASQGASTITQQLARILFLSNEKTFARKIKEIQIAARIEKTLPKDKILEMYLNNVYLGSGAYGAGAAASTYFNKELSKLTLAECALIAGLPQAPSEYSPYRNMKKAKARRDKVLKRMYIMKKITKEQYEKALKEPIVLNRKKEQGKVNIAPYFIDYVMKELEELGYNENEISQGGYNIITTLDYDAQIAANEAIEKNMAAWKMTKPKQQAALFSFSPMTGEIKAYCGGKDYSESQYDRVTQAIRPPGSSFKPIVYTAALQKGWQPNDVIEDEPFTIGKWSPKNYGAKYRGYIPLYKALAVSSNIAAVRLIYDIGITPVSDTAKTLGITTPLNYDYTISLGSNGVKLFDMAVVYGAFANGGYRVKPYAISRIETQKGRVIYRAGRTKIDKVLDKETAGLMTAMLREVIKSGTGRGADIGKPMGGKTGTTNDNRDAWFIGYTPDLVTGVFVGNDNNTSTGLTGGTLPARIWKDMMKTASQKYGDTDFDYMPYEFIDRTAQMKKEEEESPEDMERNVQDSDGENTASKAEFTSKQQEGKPDSGLAESFKTIPVKIPFDIINFKRDKKENNENKKIIPLPSNQ